MGEAWAGEVGLAGVWWGDCQPSHQHVLLFPLHPVIFKEEPLPDASLRGFPSASGPPFGSDMAQCQQTYKGALSKEQVFLPEASP